MQLWLVPGRCLIISLSCGGLHCRLKLYTWQKGCGSKVFVKRSKKDRVLPGLLYTSEGLRNAFVLAWEECAPRIWSLKLEVLNVHELFPILRRGFFFPPPMVFFSVFQTAAFRNVASTLLSPEMFFPPKLCWDWSITATKFWKLKSRGWMLIYLVQLGK